MDYSNLVSGLIGSVIGSIIGLAGSFGLYWFDRHETNRRALNDYLTALLDDVHWNGNDSNINETWERSLRDLLYLQSSVSSFSFPAERNSLRKAWEEYKHKDSTVENQATADGVILMTKQRPQTKDELKRRIHNFLQALKPNV